MSSRDAELLQHLLNGSEPSDDERSIIPSVEDQIRALNLPDESKTLIQIMLARSVRMAIPNVMGIWSIAVERQHIFPGLKSTILWVERGGDGKLTGERKGGYEHMLDHTPESMRLGIQREELVEVAQAATNVGTYAGSQNTRPVLLLLYKDIPLAVAITVGSNGFVVGMNHQSFRKYLAKGLLHINGVGRWKSALGDIDPTNPSFQGWVHRAKGESHLEYWEYIKNRTVQETSDSEPLGEWVYTPPPPNFSFTVENGQQAQWSYWQRCNVLSGVRERR